MNVPLTPDSLIKEKKKKIWVLKVIVIFSEDNWLRWSYPIVPPESVNGSALISQLLQASTRYILPFPIESLHPGTIRLKKKNSQC